MAEQTLPPQQQEDQPGRQAEMSPQPETEPQRRATGLRLTQRVGVVTGGDSGIGRAVAVAFAREGADVAVVYLDEHEDARETQRLVELEGRRCELYSADLGDAAECARVAKEILAAFRRVDILVNNAAEQHPQERLEDITREQLEQTFRTNVFSMFSLTTALLPALKPGAVIINTASVTAYKGSPTLVDYSATKGAIVAFSRSLALQLVGRGIRVNAVAPGPIWTPLIPSTFPSERVETFGADTPMGRPGQPAEVAPTYVFLASDDSSYMSGQVLHPNGGEVVNA
jgi:NAD(P)-dependent dehydrogenase (short-subunit alcohol dehydrogenase family)